jgi:hypothetical protein
MLTAILQYEKFHEKCLSHKIVSSKLTREYYLWKGCSGEYSKEEDVKVKEALLIKNCEEILFTEATEYVNLFSSSRPTDTQIPRPTNNQNINQENK